MRTVAGLEITEHARPLRHWRAESIAGRVFGNMLGGF